MVKAAARFETEEKNRKWCGMKNNIILIGMPGVGKSTIGVVLAKRLGYQFVDCDLVMQEQQGKLLYEIIEEKGIDGFLEIENQTNTALQAERAIVATGGSAVYGREAMKHLREIGTVVYLKLSYEAIQERLGDLNERGVAVRDGQTLLDLYQERVPLYEAYADIILDCEAKSIRDIAAQLGEVCLS